MDAHSSIFIIGFFYFLTRHGSSSNSVDRIISGSDTNIESVPYVVSFMLNGEYACCAAIINNYWAVTAAHCVRQGINFGNEITVRSGSSVLYEGVVHLVTEIVIHEEYNELNNDYDIAVIKVTPPFTYDYYTKAVNLAPDAEVSNDLGTVCGWGYYKKIENFVEPVLSTQLQCIRLPLINKNVCNQDYNYILTSRMICYGFESGEGDSCKGDSGSALVNENNILIGLTSWGSGCANMHSPGVYTDTVLLRNWIKDNIEL